jgi:hypothetical protein
VGEAGWKVTMGLFLPSHSNTNVPSTSGTLSLSSLLDPQQQRLSNTMPGKHLHRWPLQNGQLPVVTLKNITVSTTVHIKFYATFSSQGYNSIFRQNYWELWASMACYRESFIFLPYTVLTFHKMGLFLTSTMRALNHKQATKLSTMKRGMWTQ